MTHSAALHAHTPTLSVVDSRGLAIRSLSFHRTQTAQPASGRVDRAAYDVAARLIGRWDPRLSADTQASANLRHVHSLSQQVLARIAVDSGWHVRLPGEAGQWLEEWTERGMRRQVEYDSMLRPVAVFEGQDNEPHCIERLSYGGSSDTPFNQCGQLLRHDDPAGSLANLAFSLNGNVIRQARRFLNELEAPDWPPLIDLREDLLEPGEGAISGWRFGPLGDALEQTDAEGNLQRFLHTVAGQLKASSLQLQGQAARLLIVDIDYDAQQRVASQTAGNGVVTVMQYEPANGRLARLRAKDGHLQDLHYSYDPVGNVLSIEDRAQPVRHHANQQIEPLRTFAYDTLYQLIEATGYEAAVTGRGPGRDRFHLWPTANELSNYSQRYEYDAGGNLQTLVHVGGQNFTRRFATSRWSNRSVLQLDDRPPDEAQIAAAFDAAGNLRELRPGQDLNWNLRNQLSEVVPVERESAVSDRESYRYDAARMRVRKVRTRQARSVAHRDEVRYLPGLEIRNNSATAEALRVITVSAGHGHIRVLHWQSAPPANVSNDQIRYSLTDHLGSSTLEVDVDAQLISQEIYYPYGETAWFAGPSAVQAQCKTIRYSGKERDATGLYDYGLRYYAPWLMRWVNPDPAGEAGGINLFCFVRNSPVRFVDALGLIAHDQQYYERKGAKVSAWGMASFSTTQRARVAEAIEISTELLSRTQRLLASDTPDPGLSRAMTSTFGSLNRVQSQEVMKWLAKDFSAMQSYIKSLDNTRDKKLGLFERVAPRPEVKHPVPDGVVGITFDGVEGKRQVVLSAAMVAHSHPLDRAWALIHESSHATAPTNDLFYNDIYQLPDGSDKDIIARWSSHVAEKLQKTVAEGPSTGNVGNDPFNEVVGKYVRPRGGRYNPTTEFIQDPVVRGKTLMHNADTFPAFIMSTNLPAEVMSQRPSAASKKRWCFW